MRSFDVEPLKGYDPTYGLLLATLQDGTREWLEELGEPSEDALVWQPISGGHSIGGLVLHIAEVEAWWFEEAALGRKLSEEDLALFMSRESDVDAGKWPTPPRKPWSWYAELLASVRARTLRTLLDFPEPSSTIQRQNLLTFRWIVAHVVEHDSYHGGQAVLLKALYEGSNAMS